MTVPPTQKTLAQKAQRPAAESDGGKARAGAALGAAMIGFFVITLDALIVNVALPSIGKDLGGGITGLQWVVDGYTLLLAALLLSSGAISDRVGARQAFGAGLALFLAASAACGLAPNLGVLVGARFVQGAGAAVMMPATLALIREGYPDAGKRAKALGMWALGGSIGSAAGPVLGGALTALSWRWIFFINVPVGVVALLLLARVARSPKRPAPFDWIGQVTAVVAMGAITYTLIEGGADGFARPRVLIAVAAAVVALAVFLADQARNPQPMMPLDLFRSRPVVISLTAGFALNIGFYGLNFLLTLYFQDLRGLTPMATGVAFLPMTVLTGAVALASATVVRRFGAKATMVAGQVIMAAGLLILCLLPAHVPIWAVALMMMPVGGGGSLAVPAMTGLLLQSVPAARAGLAGGVLNTFRQFGGALAVAVFGALVAGQAGLLHGMRVGLVAATVLLLTTAALGLLRRVRH